MPSRIHSYAFVRSTWPCFHEFPVVKFRMLPVSHAGEKSVVRKGPFLAIMQMKSNLWSLDSCLHFFQECACGVTTFNDASIPTHTSSPFLTVNVWRGPMPRTFAPSKDAAKSKLARLV